MTTLTLGIEEDFQGRISTVKRKIDFAGIESIKTKPIRSKLIDAFQAQYQIIGDFVIIKADAGSWMDNVTMKGPNLSELVKVVTNALNNNKRSGVYKFEDGPAILTFTITWE